MERIVVIDHDNHKLFVEDIDDEMLQKKYHGEEEEYIKDNYTLGENWSWDYIIDAEYIPNDFDDPIEIDFYNLKP